MPTFPAELASSNSPPKSWAWCKHSWAKPNSHLLIASPVHVKVYTIQHYVIKFVSDLRQVGIFIRLLRFPLNENYLKPKFILWYVLYIHNYYSFNIVWNITVNFLWFQIRRMSRSSN
jgi:hypothetical protein